MPFSYKLPIDYRLRFWSDRPSKPSRLPLFRNMSHEPIQTLLNANKEWAQSVIKDAPDFFTQSATGQSPKILWIGCSDSRVPESVITASKPGDIFVHRNIANQFHLNDDSALSVLTYALKVVGVEHVVLVGHSNCGGAAACLKAVEDAAADPGASQPDTPLTRWLSPLIAHVQSLDLSACSASEALNKVVESNVIAQVDNICKSEPIITAWADPNARKVTVHGWVYDLARGQIDELVFREAQA
ncbi:carbonic anhydrase [Suillus bovinus]|uniref:carbonic anhydrase n=1 Tax=Suillus bovinus TaxID=48563 RepID=UPI001B8628B7|nr:carbonic anhydrase [Suillus bovinus]KAG2145442.1 carbonic anhydrase [Suillus bovinus]